ncbi:hypothetical protein [Eisenbergiella tayi]|uniref:hypothetical protein n=1 Tax=Eisenbergiella tayi TaxID=1432052 RepID=UPI001C262AED|nr:hypothetical protein [Eisenbergiella tayi]
MKKKLVSLLLVLAMAATGLAGCAGNSAGTGDSAEQSGEEQGESQTVSTPPLKFSRGSYLAARQ